MILLLLVTVAAGAYAVTLFVPVPPTDLRRALAALAGWAFTLLLLQISIGQGSRTTPLVLLIVLALVAAVPLVLAHRAHQHTHRLLDDRWRGLVAIAVGVAVSSLVAAVVTAGIGLVVGGSSSSPESHSSSTTTSTEPTTTRPLSVTTTTETTTTSSTVPTSTTVPGPVRIKKATTSRESASGPLHISIKGFSSTKSSVTFSFGNKVGLLIIFDSGGLGQLTGQYHIVTSAPSVKSADVQIAVPQSKESTITVYVDGSPFLACHPAGTATGTCGPPG
jgi:hypothetical protein